MTRPGSEGGVAGTRSEASAGRAKLTRSAFANAKSRGKETKMAHAYYTEIEEEG